MLLNKNFLPSKRQNAFYDILWASIDSGSSGTNHSSLSLIIWSESLNSHSGCSQHNCLDPSATILILVLRVQEKIIRFFLGPVFDKYMQRGPSCLQCIFSSPWNGPQAEVLEVVDRVRLHCSFWHFILKGIGCHLGVFWEQDSRYQTDLQ